MILTLFFDSDKSTTALLPSSQIFEHVEDFIFIHIMSEPVLEKSLFSYFFTLGFVLFFHAFLLVAVVLETLKREKFARLSSAFCVTFCLFRLSSQSRPHNLHKIHGKMGKKLTLSRPWTTAPVLVCAETRVYSGHYIGHAMGRTAATRTT